MKRIAGITLTIIGIMAVLSGLILKIKGQMSVSIIGGADGPTSIFIAGKVGGTSAAAGIGIGIVLLAAVIFVIVRKNKS